MSDDITYCDAKCEYADFCERHYSHHLPTNPEGRNMWMQDFSVSIGLTAAGGAECPPCPYFLERPDPKDGLKKLRELDYGKHLRALGMTVKQYMEWVRGKEDEEDDERNP